MNQKKLKQLLYEPGSLLTGVTANKLEEVSLFLKRLGEDPKFLKVYGINWGICRAVSEACGVNMPRGKTLGNLLYSDWEHYSGDPLYPVPWGGSSNRARHAYDRFPKWEGDYGKLRCELALYLSRVFAELAELRRKERPIEFNPQTW